MHAAGPKNPLHGITLEKMVTDLQAFYGWEMLGRMIKVNCFNWQPSVKSSLTFLRKTPWARQKVEELYVDTLPDLKTGKTFDEICNGNRELEPVAEPAQDSPAPEITSGLDANVSAQDQQPSERAAADDPDAQIPA